jgi:hypothetical protein
VKSYAIGYSKHCAGQGQLAQKIQVAVSQSFLRMQFLPDPSGRQRNETFGYMMYPKVSILSGKRAIQSGGTSDLMETNSFRDPCALYGGIYPTAVPLECCLIVKVASMSF